MWFMNSADAYARLSGDEKTWHDVLEPACRRVVDAFVAGTRFNIFADREDGLVSAGDPTTQLTWMDAKCGDVVFTPRHGKCVEINALWYHALCVLAERNAGGAEVAELRDRVRTSFAETFWNPDRRCLFDCVRPEEDDARIRPNQIFAVSLPHSALSDDQRLAVVRCVEQNLLTPFGLRTLAPGENGYRGRYEGGNFERDAAYHQGTVWPWLIGGYVEAYLRVHAFHAEARAHCRTLLETLVGHLDDAGLGSVSEVFDGDPPHRPAGCPAQAWSVAELRRALCLCGEGK
jgi:predicted glycogen debranching enzyme